tara:strand:- start:4478 stop:5416 length:939 start_codon:yes stop_codon:yes gene_type:complete
VYFFVPLLELISKPNYSNTSINNEKNKINKKIYDYIIFLVFPFQYYFLFYFLHTFSIDLTTTEKIGRIISMGALCAHTINVAHELGHRFNKFDQLLSKLLLLSTLNTHFFIEHNRGHHKKVATLEDPATARKNENVYIFIIRSMVFGYISAWNLEITRLKNNGTANYFFNFRNQMTRFTLLQLTLLSVIYLIFGINVLIAFLIVSFLGIAQLELINYIEHYGLLRKKLHNGKYEKITKMHSWNANYMFSRLMLFELTRHSNHHIKASRKYQILNHLEKSPELPTGYIGCMLLSFIPPLWFYIMNPLVEKYQK